MGSACSAPPNDRDQRIERGAIDTRALFRHFSHRRQLARVNERGQPNLLPSDPPDRTSADMLCHEWLIEVSAVMTLSSGDGTASTPRDEPVDHGEDDK